MSRVVGLLAAAFILAVFAPGASASHPRTGILDESLGHLIIDIFDSEKDSFGFTGAWEEWTPPDGVDHALFELWGGAGESGEAHGHVLAEVDLEPGETYLIRVGDGGEDTAAFSARCAIPEWWECVGTVIAAGGDSATSWNQTNLVPSEDPFAIETWEGGGPGSELQPGWAIVHYWPEEDPAPNGTEAPPGGASPGPPSSSDSALQAGPPSPCRLKKKGRRPPTRIVSGRVGLDHRRAVSSRRHKACTRA